MTVILIVLVRIGLHSKLRTQKIGWSVSPNCKSNADISVVPNAYYEHQCALSIGQKYTLICKSSAGTGWNSNFLVIENKAYCKNFTNGFEERSTIYIQGKYVSLSLVDQYIFDLILHSKMI